MPDFLMWFRRDLRLTDNAALAAACSAARAVGGRVHAVFVFDTDILDGLSDCADRRVSFIWHSVVALQSALRSRGGGLHVLHGPARTLVPELAAHLGASVFAGRDFEPAARARDAEVARACALHLVKDQVMFAAEEVLTAQGRPYHVFTPYKRAWLARLASVDRASYEADLSVLAPTPALDMPSLSSLGFQAVGLSLHAGEGGAKALWDDFRVRLPDYAESRDYPARKGPSYLSIHLRFGTISIRELVRVACAAADTGSQTWLSELIWREFYQMLLWHYPETVEHAFQRAFDALPWPNPPGHFEAWCEARTGYPLVDAAMRQLNQTGYMHNRLRMVAASFLVKDLHVDWRWGERYFAAKLLDYDQAANVGGWQWSAGVGTDAQPWFRIFNPVTQSQRFDPQGAFIRRYVPELAAVPDKWLHAPWTLPVTEQTRCGFTSGRDYPPPIVDHAAARAVTLVLFKSASLKPVTDHV